MAAGEKEAVGRRYYEVIWQRCGSGGEGEVIGADGDVLGRKVERWGAWCLRWGLATRPRRGEVQEASVPVGYAVAASVDSWEW